MNAHTERCLLHPNSLVNVPQSTMQFESIHAQPYFSRANAHDAAVACFAHFSITPVANALIVNSCRVARLNYTGGGGAEVSDVDASVGASVGADALESSDGGSPSTDTSVVGSSAPGAPKTSSHPTTLSLDPPEVPEVVVTVERAFAVDAVDAALGVAVGVAVVAGAGDDVR